MSDTPPEHKPSQMIRVPTPLIGAVRSLSQLHRQGKTSEILQGLEELISNLESDSNSGYTRTSKNILEIMERLDKLELKSGDKYSNNESYHAKRIDNLEEKVEEIMARMNQFTDAIIQIQNYINNQPNKKSKSRYKNSSYQGQSPQIQPLTEENLAKRLGVNLETLIKSRTDLPSPHFVAWCKHRDTSNLGWEYNQDTGLYHPLI
ncbi:MAG: hypothetical protein AAF316_16775 [Cyanobacteria bacterium P01_A01_bin.80]